MKTIYNMNKTKLIADMNHISYCSPETLVLDLIPEGLLCGSPLDNSSASDFILGDELGEGDYEQIF